MALNERDMRGEMDREITIPGEPAIPLTYPITWSGPSSNPAPVSAKGNTQMSGLDEILTQIATSMSGQSTQIAGLENQKADSSRATAAQQQEVLADKVAINQQVSRAAMAAQDAGIAARDQLENNPNDPNSLMAMLTNDFVTYTKAAREQRDGIIAKKQVGLLDNPLEFLWNTITLPDEINAMRATQAKADNAVQGIERMQQMTTAAAAAQAATKKTITEQVIAAQTKVDIADGQAAIAKINREALGSDIEGIKALQNADAKKAEYLIAANSASNQAVHLQLSKNADAREQDRWSMIKREKEQDETAQDVLAKKASIGAGLGGQSNLTYEEIKFQRKTKSMSDAKFSELVRRGEQWIEAQARGLPAPTAVAATPGEAILSLRFTDGLNGPQYAPVKDALNKYLDEAMEVAKTKGLKTADQARNFLSSYVNDKIQGVGPDGKPNPKMGDFYKLSINRDAPNNYLKAPELPDLASIPGVQSQKAFYESVITPAVATNNKDSSVKNVLALGLEARRRGEITTEQLAAGMEALYTSANNALYSTSLSKLNFPYQSKYLVELNNPVGFGKDRRNWADKGQVLDFLNMIDADASYKTSAQQSVLR